MYIVHYTTVLLPVSERPSNPDVVHGPSNPDIVYGHVRSAGWRQDHGGHTVQVLLDAGQGKGRTDVGEARYVCKARGGGGGAHGYGRGQVRL